MTASATDNAPADGLPGHIAIVMDGNGRWARARGMPRGAGHRAGVKAARRIVEACGHRKIGTLTLFAFSSENFKRPGREVRMLMKLFVEALQREVSELNSNDVRLSFIGDRAALAPSLVRQIEASERLTADNNGLRLVIAIAYGGRWDICNAVRNLADDVRAGRIEPVDIDESAVSRQLALCNLPDPDLFIRTGGESRVSNFLLWNLAYSELYFCDTYWPDFDVASLDAAIAFFARRQRRFGRTAEQVGETG